MKKFLLYLLRWQLSTPIIWAILTHVDMRNEFLKTMIANLVGALIFFWIDRFIFRLNEKS